MDDVTPTRHSRLARFRGNGVAIALAALAVVIAGTGTAVAAASVVNIGDGKNPAVLATVESSGRLRVGTPLGTINTFANGKLSDWTFLTSPTKATIAVSALNFTNPAGNRSLSGSDWQFDLYRFASTSSTTCEVNGSAWYGRYTVPPGQTVTATFPSPLTFEPPSNGQSYCIGVFSGMPVNATTSASVPKIQMTGYVASGTYTRLGTNPPWNGAANKAALLKAAQG